jgi:protein SCO1/2
MPICKCETRRGLVAVLGAVAGLLLLTGGYLWMLGGTTPSRPAIGGPFTLTAANGQAVTEQSFRGRYVLLYFGYTSCRDVCPITLSAVADALDVLGPKAARVQPLFVTVDPARDTPAVVGRYVAGFTPRIVGLTGTQAEIRQMELSYHVTSLTHPGAGPTEYTVDHSSVLYLIGPDGRYLAPIRADGSGKEIATAISLHLS